MYDLLIRNGVIYDGRGGVPYLGAVAINGDTIAAVTVNALSRHLRGKIEIDAKGMAVAPGFINVMSHAEQSLVADGRSQSDIRQGVTLEVLGESYVGPLNDALTREWKALQGDIQFDIAWRTFGGYFEWLVTRGISCNIASFVPLMTIRPNVLGYVDRVPTEAELAQMCALVKQSMEEGALGLATALIYPPDCYAKTPELIALAKVASAHGGLYISHIRSEGNQFLAAIDELLHIARAASIPAEIYHLKAAGRSNWQQMDEAIAKVDAARAEGLRITADMYTYTAGSTGLNACFPPWAHAGGFAKLVERLKEPALRARIKHEMNTTSNDWENMYEAAGVDNILLVAFKQNALKPLTGKTLAEVAKLRGQPPEETAMDLVIEDDSRVGTVYFMMDEANLRKQVAVPWVSFGSDSASVTTEGVFLKSNPHPRTYGCFARLLAKYVRDEKIITLQEAVRRLTSFPAQTYKLPKRGSLTVGHFADVVIFDPDKTQDHATFDQPHQYATGVMHVFVNGVQVLREGEHTGAQPGRFVPGPGWRGRQ